MWSFGRLSTTTVVLGQWAQDGRWVAGYATTAADGGLHVGCWRDGQLSIQLKLDGHPGDSLASVQRILRAFQ